MRDAQQTQKCNHRILELTNQNWVFPESCIIHYNLDTPLCVLLCEVYQEALLSRWCMHQWETVRCDWVIGYTHFNQMLRERMRTYVIVIAEKERHIRRKENKCFFPVIFELPEEQRQELTCHNTSWNVCSFLAFYESLFALWGGKSKRGGKQFQS